MLVGTLGIFLTVVAALGVFTGGGVGAVPLGWSTAVIGFVYVAGMRLLHRNREEPVFRTPAETAEAARGRPELRFAVMGFGGSALIILIAAPFLAASAAELADSLGISHGFGGMLFLAITTSLPEAAVSYGSVRAGAYNLAVGNLLGSNCFSRSGSLGSAPTHCPKRLGKPSGADFSGSFKAPSFTSCCSRWPWTSPCGRAKETQASPSKPWRSR
jgi:cation:H+ antiporter